MSCPACGSVDISIFDKGWNRLLRILALNPRLVCRNCKCSWRRRTPEKMTKVKRKGPRLRSDRIRVHKVLPIEDALWCMDEPEIAALAESWRVQGFSHVCLDLQGRPVTSPNAVAVLMRLYRKVRDQGGGLLITNATESFKDLLWISSVGYLIHMDQKLQV